MTLPLGGDLARRGAPAKFEGLRQTILKAATRLFADERVSASTAPIAKAASVAEGTTFTYFATKEELTNALYLDLKASASRLRRPPRVERFAGRPLAVLVRLCRSGLAKPVKRQALAKMQASDRIAADTRESAAQKLRMS